MNMNMLRRVVGLAVLLFIILFAVGYLWRVSSKAEAGPLMASGTVEGIEVRIGPEMGGRVVEVLVSEGQHVEPGDVLFRQDDELLSIQRDLVAAAGESAIASARYQLLTAELALDQIHEDADVVAAQAQLELANAMDQLDTAEYTWSVRQEGNRASLATIDAAEANLMLAEIELDQAQSAYNKVEHKPDDSRQKAIALSQLSSAQQRYDSALRNLNWYKGEPTEIEQAQLDAEVAIAEALVAKAKLEWEKVRDGPDPEILALREAAVEQARAQLTLAQAQAASDLSSIELQLEKLTIRSSVAGTVIARSIEPGEVILPGSAALSILQDDVLTITVYVAEDRYGTIDVGDKAKVEVDTFPGLTFEAMVTRVADRAEFTPRNVQTEEGRRTTVFAIELSVIDPEGHLKPGMPADVRFEE